MIPPEVTNIADLICDDWRELPDDAANQVIDAAVRIYEAGYRLPEDCQ